MQTQPGRHEVPSLPTHTWLLKLFRFGTIGAVSAVLYFAAVALLVKLFDVEPRVASILGYLVSVPLSFYGHRLHTFRSDGRLSAEGTRFVATHLIGMGVMLGSMHIATKVLSAPFWVGSAFGTLIVPAVSFVVMNLWVFRDQADRASHSRRPRSET